MKNDIKILYLVNNLAFFVSHRLPIALAAQDKGYSVNIITGVPGSQIMEAVAKKKLKDTNLKYKMCVFRSSSINLFFDLIGFIQLIMNVYITKPTIIHCISPKAIIYGGLVARIIKTKSLILSVSGMGYAFTNRKSFNIFRWIISILQLKILSIILKHPNIRLIVQNENDREIFIKLNILDSNNIKLIPGSGIELKKYKDLNLSKKEKIVLFPARMLWDKGVKEFVDAAKNIKQITPEWRFIMAGAADYKHPTSVSEKYLNKLCAEQIIDWKGYVEDIVPLYLSASIVCLPSYREGYPKCLLEAAAAGCAIVTTDTVGCRDSVVPNVSGLLVPIGNSEKLEKAILILIKNQIIRESFGKSGYELAIKKFDISKVIKETLLIYRDTLEYESIDKIKTTDFNRNE